MTETEEPIRVFLLDDHEVVRRGIAATLEAEPDLTVVGEASSAADALEEVRRCNPDVAVLDVRLGDGSGITGVKLAIFHATPGLHHTGGGNIIVMHQHARAVTVKRSPLIGLGARRGYHHKLRITNPYLLPYFNIQ